MSAKQGCFPSNTIAPGQFPYTPAIVVGDQVYISGQGPIDPDTGKIKGDTVQEQVELTLLNVQRVLACGGATMDDVVKITAYLSDIKNFDKYNAIYKKYFKEPRPARTTVEARLWGGILVEVDAIAIKGCGKKG